MASSSGISLKLSNNEFNGSQTLTLTTKQDLKKYFKLKLLLEILKSFCTEGGDYCSTDKNGYERVVNLTKPFIAKHFLQNIGVPDFIQVTPNIHLSYTEKQLINGYLLSQIEKSFSDSINIIRTIKEKNPEYLNSNIIPEKAMIDLELNRLQLYKDLVLIQQKKYKQLLSIIEARLSPQVEQKMLNILKEFELLDAKAERLYSILTHHVTAQTPYAAKALKIIEDTIDRKLKDKL